MGGSAWGRIPSLEVSGDHLSALAAKFCPEVLCLSWLEGQSITEYATTLASLRNSGRLGRGWPTSFPFQLSRHRVFIPHPSSENRACLPLIGSKLFLAGNINIFFASLISHPAQHNSKESLESILLMQQVNNHHYYQQQHNSKQNLNLWWVTPLLLYHYVAWESSGASLFLKYLYFFQWTPVSSLRYWN